MDTNLIRRGLYNIKSRADTMDLVIEGGGQNLSAVIPLLQDRDEGIRWATLRILAEIGDISTVPTLIELLDQSRNTTDVLQALKSITSQDLGDKPAAWREWLLNQSAGVAGVLSDQELLSSALKGLPATLEGHEGDYSVLVTLPNHRHHTIQVDFSIKDNDGHALVQLTTPCGAADPAHYEEALKLNMSIPSGAIGLALVDDVLSFAVSATHRRATLHPSDLAESIMSLACYGDMMEQKLSSQDVF